MVLLKITSLSLYSKAHIKSFDNSIASPYSRTLQHLTSSQIVPISYLRTLCHEYSPHQQTMSHSEKCIRTETAFQTHYFCTPTKYNKYKATATSLSTRSRIRKFLFQEQTVKKRWIINCPINEAELRHIIHTTTMYDTMCQEILTYRPACQHPLYFSVHHPL